MPINNVVVVKVHSGNGSQPDLHRKLSSKRCRAVSTEVFLQVLDFVTDMYVCWTLSGDPKLEIAFLLSSIFFVSQYILNVAYCTTGFVLTQLGYYGLGEVGFS